VGTVNDPAGVAFLADYGLGEQSPTAEEPVKGTLQSFLSGLSKNPVEGR
jgi:hypothetical protein